MATIKEAYCSPEVTKLLKEKGFDYQGFDYIDFEGKIIRQDRPTLQTAMKWLREVHNIFIEISTSIDLNGKYHYSYTILDKECKYIRRGYTDFDWNYEETCKAAIKYCLENLI